MVTNIIQIGNSRPSVGLLLNGFKVSLIPVMYGMMIYALSLVIRLVQKPRI